MFLILQSAGFWWRWTSGLQKNYEFRMCMETETRKRYLDHNIRGINSLVQLPRDAFALALVKHGLPGLVPQTIVLFPTSNCWLHLMTLLIVVCSDKRSTSVTQDLAKQVPEVQKCKLKQQVHFTTVKKKFRNITIAPTLAKLLQTLSFINFLNKTMKVINKKLWPTSLLLWSKIILKSLCVQQVDLLLLQIKTKIVAINFQDPSYLQHPNKSQKQQAYKP